MKRLKEEEERSNEKDFAWHRISERKLRASELEGLFGQEATSGRLVRSIHGQQHVLLHLSFLLRAQRTFKRARETAGRRLGRRPLYETHQRVRRIKQKKRKRRKKRLWLRAGRERVRAPSSEEQEKDYR